MIVKERNGKHRGAIRREELVGERNRREDDAHDKGCLLGEP